jgi:hypothetical protein
LYVSRFVQELGDHIHDLSVEQKGAVMGMEAVGEALEERDSEKRLGNQDCLTEQALAQFRNGFFASRHPIVSFVLGPIVGTIAALVLFLASAVLLCWGLAWALGDPGAIHKPAAQWPAALRWTVDTLGILAGFVPPLMIIVVWNFLFRQSGRSAGWYIWSCAITSLLAGVYVIIVTPPSASSSGEVAIGIVIAGATWVRQLCQLLVPLIVGGFFLWRGRHERPDSVGAPVLENS